LLPPNFFGTIVFNQEFFVALRTGAARHQNGIHHRAEHEIRAAVRAADLLFGVRKLNEKDKRKAGQ